MRKTLKDEIKLIVSGKSQNSESAIIQTIANYLRVRNKTSLIPQESKYFKIEETKDLIKFIQEHNLWVTIDLNSYVSEGAEQKVYLKNESKVSKLNDSIYYTSWFDYLINLLVHNFFFPDTAYELAGFTEIEGVLYAVVEQPYVTITEATDLKKVKLFFESNGFINNRNHDYFNKDLGVIIEDLHDENVLTKDGILYFIDTVIFLTEEFYK